MNFLAEIESPLQGTDSIRQRIYSLETQIGLLYKQTIPVDRQLSKK